MQSCKKIIVVGEGLAGQLTALGLHTHLAQLGVEVTLISLQRSLPALGVIRDTSTLKVLLEYAGLDSKRWYEAADVKASMTTRFIGWAPETFDFPCATDLDPFAANFYEALTVSARQGVQLDCNPTKFSIAYYLDKHGLSGTTLENFPFEVHPFLSFNVEKLEAYLNDQILATNIQLTEADNFSVNQIDAGRVQSVTVNEQTLFSADLYIDCTDNYAVFAYKNARSFGKSPFSHEQILSVISRAASDKTQGILQAAEFGWCQRVNSSNNQVLSYHFSTEVCSADKAKKWLSQLNNVEGAFVLRPPKSLPSQFPLSQDNLVAVGHYLADLPLGGGAFLLYGLLVNIVDRVLGVTDVVTYNDDCLSYLAALYDVELVIADLHQSHASPFWRQKVQALPAVKTSNNYLDRWSNIQPLIDPADDFKQNLLGKFQWEVLFGGMQAFPPPTYTMSNNRDYESLIESRNTFIQRCLNNFTLGDKAHES